MVTKAEAIAELYRRGALKGQQKAAYEELARRGLVGDESRALLDARKRVSNTPSQVRALAQGISFGFADELDAKGAGIETALGNVGRSIMRKPLPYSPQQAEAAVLQANREGDRQFLQEHPVQSIGSNLIGGIATGIATGGGSFVAGGATLPGVIGRSALVGAGSGALGGAGAAEGGYGSRLSGAGKGAAVGAVTGAAAPIAGRVVQAVGNAAGRRVAPTIPLEKLQQTTRAAYDAVDNAGVTYSDRGFNRMVDNIQSDLASVNLNPMRHPKAASMLAELQDMKGRMPSLTELDQIRQVVRRDVANASDEAEAFMGKRIIKQIDSFVEGADGADLNAGAGSDGARLVNEARGANTRMRKLESVDEAIEAARLRASSSGSGGNVNNATRQELRRVYENGNWTPDERAALLRAIEGNASDNVLRQVGKLSPSGNGLMGGLNLASAASFGPAGAVPGAVGMIAKTLADAATAGNVEEARRIISNGGRAVQQVISQNPQLAQAITRLGIPVANVSGQQQGYAAQLSGISQ